MRKTTIQFAQEASIIHSNVYDYSLVSYKNNITKVIIICSIHGNFLQTPLCHITNKTGCPNCAILTRQQTNLDRYGYLGKHPSIESKEKKRQTCLGKYGTEYAQQSQIIKNKRKQTCLEHHGVEFPTQSKNIIKIRTLANVIKYGVPSPKQSHMIDCLPSLDDYNWLYNQYVTNLKTATQISNELKVDQSTICKYLRLHNIKIRKYCPQSANCIRWLTDIMVQYNINIQHVQNGGEYKIPNTQFSVDGYCIENNTIYEFHGDFWHGNPSKYESHVINPFKNQTMGDLYQKTIDRENKIRSLGYNLVIMWERDFNPS